MDLFDFFQTPFGASIAATAVPIVFGLIYFFAKLYKENKDEDANTKN